MATNDKSDEKSKVFESAASKAEKPAAKDKASDKTSSNQAEPIHTSQRVTPEPNSNSSVPSASQTGASASNPDFNIDGLDFHLVGENHVRTRRRTPAVESPNTSASAAATQAEPTHTSERVTPAANANPSASSAQAEPTPTSERDAPAANADTNAASNQNAEQKKPDNSEEKTPNAKSFKPNINSQNPFEILGIDPNMPKTQLDKEVNRAFRQLSLQYHPDKNPDPKSQEIFQKINNAKDEIRAKLHRESEPAPTSPSTKSNNSNNPAANERANFNQQNFSNNRANTPTPKPNASSASAKEKTAPAPQNFSNHQTDPKQSFSPTPPVQQNNLSDEDIYNLYATIKNKFSNTPNWIAEKTMPSVLADELKSRMNPNFILLVPQRAQPLELKDLKDTPHYQKHSEKGPFVFVTLNNGSKITLHKDSGTMLLDDNKPETLAAAANLIKQQNKTVENYEIKTANNLDIAQASDTLKQQEQQTPAPKANRPS